MKRKIIKTENSLAVTLPDVLAKELSLKAGDDVEVEIVITKNCTRCYIAGKTDLHVYSYSAPTLREAINKAVSSYIQREKLKKAKR